MLMIKSAAHSKHLSALISHYRHYLAQKSQVFVSLLLYMPSGQDSGHLPSNRK